MDIGILLVTYKMLKCSTTYARIFIGALLGASVTSIITIFSLKNGFMKFILYHVLIPGAMIRAGLRIKSGRRFLQAYICVYISAILFGGVLEIANPYLRESSIFFGIAVISYWIVLAIWDVVSWLGKRRNDCCEVTLYHQGKEVKVRAIIDTGNRLKDTVSGKSVSVISKEAAQELVMDLTVEGIRFIPFHTVGTKAGVMPLISIEKMCLHLDIETVVQNPLLAISAEIASTDDYELILSPDV